MNNTIKEATRFLALEFYKKAGFGAFPELYDAWKKNGKGPDEKFENYQLYVNDMPVDINAWGIKFKMDELEAEQGKVIVKSVMFNGQEYLDVSHGMERYYMEGIFHKGVEKFMPWDLKNMVSLHFEKDLPKWELRIGWGQRIEDKEMFESMKTLFDVVGENIVNDGLGGCYQARNSKIVLMQGVNYKLQEWRL